MTNLRSSLRHAQTQDDVPLTIAWMTVEVIDGVIFTPDSLIIKNNDDTGILYFREAVDKNIIPIDPGETYETSLNTRTSFQIRGEMEDMNYKTIASVN